MNHEDAKFILQAYRPDGSDAGDAMFASALKLAREDPVLAGWFERQQAFDRAIAAKIVMVEPPAELRSAILAGARVSGKPRAAWWQRPQWLAMAAGVLLLFSAGVAVWPRASASAPFLSFVANDAHHSETHGGSGVPAENLQAKLTEPTTHLGNGLTADFDTLRSTGCRSISFQGHDVLEVCFKRDGSWFHCYIARPVDFPALAGLSKPVITELDHEDVAAWADSAHVYLVAGDVGLGALKRLL